MKKFEVFHIQNLQNLLKVDNYLLSEKKKDQLNYELQIKKLTQQEVFKKQKKNNLYLNYSRNPFSQNIQKVNNNKIKQNQTLVYVINTIKQKPIRQQFINAKYDTQININQRRLISNKISSNFTKTDFIKHFQKHSIKQFNRQNTKKNIEIQKTQFPKKLTQINLIKQSNVNIKQNNTNIMKISHQTLKKNRPKPIQFLELHHFVHNSISRSFSNILRLNTFRQLSKMGRSLMQNRQTKQNVLDHMTNTELVFNIHQISYQDIQNITSNRMNPKLVWKYIYDISDNQQEQQSSEEQINYIYTQKQLEKKIQTDDINNQKLEIQLLKSAPLLEMQQNINKKLRQLERNIKIEAESKLNVLKEGVSDKKVHQLRKQKIIKKLRQIQFQKIEDDEFVRNIAYNKKNKSKKQYFQFQTLKAAVHTLISQREKQQQLLKTALFL